MTIKRKTSPDAFEKHDGWQKHMAKKAAGEQSTRYNGALFCLCLKNGRIAGWRPYNPPRSLQEILKSWNSPPQKKARR